MTDPREDALAAYKRRVRDWLDTATEEQIRRSEAVFTAAALSAPPTQSEPGPVAVLAGRYGDPSPTPYVRPAAEIQAEIERCENNRLEAYNSRHREQRVAANEARIASLRWTLIPPTQEPTDGRG